MTSSPFLIDAHEDLAYSALTFGRDYRWSAHEIRAAEALGDGTAEQHNGQAVLGWPDYQRGQVAVVVATLFSEPMGKGGGEWETQVYRNPAEARQTWQRQVDFYERLAGDRPDQFALVRTRADLTRVLSAWEQAPARWSEAVDEAGRPLSVTHPVGLILLMEGCEGIRAPRDKFGDGFISQASVVEKDGDKADAEGVGEAPTPRKEFEGYGFERACVLLGDGPDIARGDMRGPGGIFGSCGNFVSHDQRPPRSSRSPRN